MRVEQFGQRVLKRVRAASRSTEEMLYGFTAALDVRSGAGGERASRRIWTPRGGADGITKDRTRTRPHRVPRGQTGRWPAGSLVRRKFGFRRWNNCRDAKP